MIFFVYDLLSITFNYRTLDPCIVKSVNENSLEIVYFDGDDKIDNLTYLEYLTHDKIQTTRLDDFTTEK